MKWPLAAAIALILAAAVGGGAWWYRTRAGQAKIAEAPAPAPVQDVSGEISLTGTIDAREIVNVASPMEGKVIAFRAEVGDEVYEGQLLAEIGNEMLSAAQQGATELVERTQERFNELEAAVASARLEASRASADYVRVKGEFERASRNWNREKMLLAEGATPRQKAERAETEFKNLQSDLTSLEGVARGSESRLASLQQTLDNSRRNLEARTEDLESAKARVESGQIFSPVNGIVVSRRGAPGDDVNPAMDDLFRIGADITSLTVTVEPNPAVLAKIKPDMPALIIIADIPNEAIPGVVSSVEKGRVVIDFSTPTPIVKPGHSAQVRLRIP
ncbi:MAG: efflux RND transporter periplasmic adaptor subunit [Bryobacteraceae bacterium]|nr:efflux RND transporter periplasmic adaptor subunit [Bryobacteraceae bacterium]